MIRLELDRPVYLYRPGETLTATVTFDATDNIGTIFVTLFWHVNAEGVDEVTELETQMLTTNSGQAELQATFKLPILPYSFSGPLGTLCWGVEAVGTPGNRQTEIEFELRPGERPIVLPRVEPVKRSKWSALRVTW